MTDFTPKNPRGVIPCGASDALMPEPVHYDCASCKRIAMDKLKARTPPRHKGHAAGTGRVPVHAAGGLKCDS